MECFDMNCFYIKETNRQKLESKLTQKYLNSLNNAKDLLKKKKNAFFLILYFLIYKCPCTEFESGY